MCVAGAATDNGRSMGSTESDDLFEMPMEVLACSPPARLLRLRSSEWLPFGGRAVRGGVGMLGDRTIVGWLAYGRSDDDLACPSWPSQALALSLDQIFPASVEIEFTYRGPDWRRAAGSVNARLQRECQDTRTRVPLEQAEQAERTVSARMAGEAHRQARREFLNPAWHSDELI
jgi:hypothetical protein